MDQGQRRSGNFQDTEILARESRTSRTIAYFSSIRSGARINNIDSQTARAVRGGWGYSRNHSKRLFATTFTDYEHDKFQAPDLRIVLGGGLGYKVWTAESGPLALVGGAAWNHEKISPGTSADFTRSSAEAYWGNDFSYKLGARTTWDKRSACSTISRARASTV